MMMAIPAVRHIRALVESSRLPRTRENSDIMAPRTLSSTPMIIRARTAQKAPLIQKGGFRTLRVCVQLVFDLCSEGTCRFLLFVLFLITVLTECFFHYSDLETSAQLQTLIRKKLLQKNNQIQERRFLFFKGF